MEQRLASQVYAQGRSLFRVAFGILRDAEAAEDACQQAFLKAWEHQDTLRSPDALRSWLTQTVIHESLRAYRRRKTEGRVLENQSRVVPAFSADNPGAGEQREKVLASVSELPEPTRTVVVLRVLEGLSGNEVKEIMQCSAVEVSRHLHRGMEILRGKLGSWQTNAGER
jgi:RNA polymerase sigma-70 factor (ECF subfamily)